MVVSLRVGGRRDCITGEPKPPFEVAIWMVALAVRSKASRHVSAGGHLSIMSVNTDFAASTVKSTSSIVCFLRYSSQRSNSFLNYGMHGHLPGGFSQWENAIWRKDMICLP